VPVATSKPSRHLQATKWWAGSQILIANTFHLHLKPGEKIVKANGGIHKFMNWQKPLRTDPAGFSVFQSWIGRDLMSEKVMKIFPGKDLEPVIMPVLIQIREDYS